MRIWVGGEDMLRWVWIGGVGGEKWRREEGNEWEVD